jgi:ankyrin repeat protein
MHQIIVKTSLLRKKNMKKLILLLIIYSLTAFGADNCFAKREKLRNEYNYFFGPIALKEWRLIDAAGTGDVAVCTQLIEAGARINILHQAPLKEAIKGKHLNCIALLIFKKAYLNQIETGLLSPLQVAVTTGSVESVTMLLNAGADPDSGVGTPLLDAIDQDHLDIAELLLARGADPKYGAGLDRPIHRAAAKGNNKAISLLVQHGADVNQRGVFGERPLHDAARNGHVHTLALLKELGAEETPNSYGEKPSDVLGVSKCF